MNKKVLSGIECSAHGALEICCRAIFVVIDHAQTNSIPSSISWWTIEIMSNGLCKVAVPFFMVVSGFFLAQHFSQKRWWGREIRKRLLSLGVPFILWSVVGAIVYTPIATSHPWTGCGNILRSVGIHPFDLPTLTPLWYLRSLLLLAVVSPFLAWCIRKGGLVTLAFWYVLSFILSKVLSPYSEWSNFCGNFFPIKWGFFWFSLGIWLQGSERGFNCSKRSGTIAFVCGLVLIFVSRYMVLYGMSLGALFQKLSYPPILYGIWCLFPRMSQFRLASYSFPIYLIHFIALWYLSYWWNADGLLGYAYRAIGAIAISIGATFLLHRYLPRFASVAFGGR